MTLPGEDERLEELLQEWGLLSRQRLDQARKLRNESGRSGEPRLTLIDTLVKYKFLTKEQIRQALNRLRSASEEVAEEVPADVTEAMDRPGTLLGKFVILGEVGRGGAAVIQRAWDTEAKRYVALKFLRATEGELTGASRIAELVREAKKAIYLAHPNIRAVYEVGSAGGRTYLAMEYLEGYTLVELIRNARAKRKVSPFYDDPIRYLGMLRDVARAIHYAHGRTPPIIHCDLKPANIFVELNWQPYVVDFGVAHELKPEMPGEEGEVKGSPAYMAPEQALGKAEEIDERTDVYGLGSILYELLTGRPPFTGDLQEVIDKNLLVPPPKPSAVLSARSAISDGTAKVLLIPPAVENLCMKALEKEKKDRLPSALAFADALDDAIKSGPVTQKTDSGKFVIVQAGASSSAAPKAHPTGWKSPARRVAVVAVALAVVGGVGLLTRSLGVDPGREVRDTLRQELDSCAARLEFEKASKGYQAYQWDATHLEEQNWAKERLEDVAATHQMWKKVVAFLKRKPLKAAVFNLRSGQLWATKVYEVSEKGLDAEANGSRHRTPWSEMSPQQIMAFINEYFTETEGSWKDEDVFGAASYAFKNGLLDADRLCDTLRKNPAMRDRVVGLRWKMPGTGKGR